MNSLPTIDWLGAVPLCPLVAAVIIFFMRRSWSSAAAGIAITAMGFTLVLSLWALRLVYPCGARLVFNFDWLCAGPCALRFGFVLDPLSSTMAAMVTFVGLLIFIYASAYMAHDPDKTRFFGYLSLFAAGMLGLIIANSILLLFMCWEIVGLASYLLIGFWYAKPSAAAAAKKAFITTRIGDLGFLVALIWLYTLTGTTLFYDNGAGILEAMPRTAFGLNTFLGLAPLTWIALLLFIGAAGKSGQFPLHVWLPDAMEGPTPVSALIHAATMVAAGVFLVARCYNLFLGNCWDLPIVTAIGIFTSLLAALCAMGQYDIKRILAYSTVSQLGLMMAGLGVGGVSAGMFHLLTHAFFKALLFLGAGSIIHGFSGEQDIRKLGGVARAMPLTSVCYLCGMLALCAFPYTAGYYSKDLILAEAYETSPAVFWLVALSALLTSFYMTRQCCYLFIGKPRSAPAHPPHESPLVMTLPLALLAVFALFGGAVATHMGLPEYLDSGRPLPPHSEFVTLVSWTASLCGILIGFLVYRTIGAWHSDLIRAGLLENSFYFDALYAVTVGRLWRFLALLADLFDAAMFILTECFVYTARLVAGIIAWRGDRRWIDHYAFDGTSEAVRRLGALCTLPQSGFLPSYLRWVTGGVTVLGLILYWQLA